MSPPASSSPPELKSRLGAILRSTSGNFLEQFDFFLFGFYASNIAKAFFPTGNEATALMLTFTTFWLGALMRPIGAVVLGAYVDRIGRRKGLIVTLAIMAIGTVLIAICPAYATIGIVAPMIVLMGRLLQGFSAGVELGGVSIYLSEISTPGNKGFYTSFQSASQQVAILVRGHHRLCAERGDAGGDDRGMGLAHSILHRLPDRAVHLRDATLAGGNAGVSGHEEASDRIGSFQLDGGELAHHRTRHD